MVNIEAENLEQIDVQSGQVLIQDRKSLVRWFWVLVGLLHIWLIYKSSFFELLPIVGASLIMIAALAPMYLWLKGRVEGLPLYPIFTLSYVWTHAIHLWGNQVLSIEYSPDSQFAGALTVTFFLTIGNITWYKIMQRPMRRPLSYRVIDVGRVDQLFLGFLAMGTFYSMAIIGNWIPEFVYNMQIFPLIRGLFLSLSTMSILILAFSIGKGTLAKPLVIIFYTLLGVFLVSNLVTLLIVYPLSIAFMFTIAYFLGAKKLPWIFMLCTFGPLIFLHYGKYDMRNKYWADNEYHLILLQPYQYAGWLIEWGGYSVNKLMNKDETSYQEEDDEATTSFTDRTKLIHMLLLVQDRSPERQPYLFGNTYWIIPEMFLPRFIVPDKLRSDEGLVILSTYYGLQNREDTEKTSIGWGPLSEAYANFGLFGCFIVAVAIASFYAFITRWCFFAPMFSSRMLFAMLVLSMSFQAEMCASVYCTALFQSAMILVAVNFAFMKKCYLREVVLENTPFMNNNQVLSRL